MQNKCLEGVPGAKRAKLLEQRRGRLILAGGMRMKSPYFQFSTTLSCREPINLVRLVSASVQSYIVGAQTTPRRDAARSQIMTDGTIHSYLEIYRFGLWLLMDGTPGLKPAPGKAADPIVVFKTVGVAAAEFLINESALMKELGLTEAAAYRHLKDATGIMTRSKMRDRWFIMYGEDQDGAFFKSRRRSAARYLDSYLAHLGEFPGKNGSMIKVRSILLEKALNCIVGKGKST